MRLLLLGGTKFLGRAVVESALSRGHEVTLFTRGQTNPDLFPEVEHLHGDRDGDLAALEEGRWDAVVDTSGYYPRIVRQSAELLRERVGRYCFISSVSVYGDFSGGVSEDAPVAKLDDETVETMGDEFQHYGGLKALCEAAVQQVYGERALIVRPGLIVGPHDSTGRFTYWARRAEDDGELLAFGPPERRVQFIDVRDLADWIVRALEEDLAGVFNATSEGVSMSELLDGRNVTWVDDAFLLEHEVGEWMGLPLWIADPESIGIHQADVSRAVAAGLRFRPVAETLRDAAAAPAVDGVGLTRERERELLDAWAARG